MSANGLFWSFHKKVTIFKPGSIQIEEEIQEILDESADFDEQEDEEYVLDKRLDELPEELRDPQNRLDRNPEAKQQLDEREQQLKDERAEKLREREQEEEDPGQKKRGRRSNPPKRIELDEERTANVTDPKSQTLKTHDGLKQGYNGQAMVDCSSQVIVAQNVTTDANDAQQLEPMLDRFEETTGERAENAMSDAGYWSEASATLQDEQTELFIPPTKDWKRRKELAEQGPPRGRIPDDYGPKELMEPKLRTKPGSPGMG